MFILDNECHIIIYCSSELSVIINHIFIFDIFFCFAGELKRFESTRGTLNILETLAKAFKSIGICSLARL
jgi:hypothetical protein